MPAGPRKALVLAILLAACSRSAPSPSVDASVIAVAAPPLVACALPLDPQTVRDQIVADPCFEDFFGRCRGACVQDCTTCGGACTTEACREQCLAVRDTCAKAKEGPCGSAYRACRAKLVTDAMPPKH